MALLLLTLSAQARTSWPQDSDPEREWPVPLAEPPRSPRRILRPVVVLSRNYADPEIHEKVEDLLFNPVDSFKAIRQIRDT